MRMASTNSAPSRKPESPSSVRQAALLLLLAGPGLLSGCNLPSAGLNPATATLISARHTQVARSQRGVVALNLDGDGDENTGWVLLNLHLAAEERVPADAWVEADTPPGHPSCEGGVSTGTHLHFARKYNGEWIPAEGPLPLVLDGWQAYAGVSGYGGWLIRDGQTVLSSASREPASEIRRGP